MLNIGEAVALSEVEQLRNTLDAAVAALLDAIAGTSQADFEAPMGEIAIRDVAWHAGLVIDWTRRAVDQGVGARPVAAFLERDCPAIARTPGYLAEWIEQCHRPLLALLRRLPDDALGCECVLATGEVRTPQVLLSSLAGELRDAADEVARRRAALGGG